MTLEELLVRPARPEDKPAVIEFTRTIWDGHDYLPKVWDGWLADPHGRLFVGEVGGKPVATYRVALLSPTYAWMEGLRVDPTHRGRGYARRIHDAALELALAIPGVQRVGLSTSWENEAVIHMSEASGMRRVADCRYLVTAAEPNDAREPVCFGPDDFTALRALVDGSECARLAKGHMADGWQFPPLEDELLRRLLDTGRVLGYVREGEPQVAVLLGQNKERDDVWIGFLAGDDASAVGELAHALRRRALDLPDPRARAMLPAALSTLPALRAAGFDDYEGEAFHVYLYERERDP